MLMITSSITKSIASSIATGLIPSTGVNNLYLAVGGDSLANRAGDTYSADLVTYCEQYYGSGNVTVENFSQGGLQTYKTLNVNSGSNNVYFWNDDTSTPSAKLTETLGYITDTNAVNGVVLFLGSNDQKEQFEALYEAGTLTDAQYQTALTELCDYLYNTAFPNSQFILIQRLHRYDTTNFPNPTWFEAVKRNQQAVIDAVSYVKSVPDIWDVDLADATHPTEGAYDDEIHHRIGDVCAFHHGKKETASTVGVKIDTVTAYADHVIATVTHDQGDDITVPANANNGIRYNLDDVDPDENKACGDITKVSATSFKVDLPNIGLGSGADEKLYASYERTFDLPKLNAEVIVDNATPFTPLRQGGFSVTEGDLVRQLTGLEVDINARAGIKTLSGSDVTAITGTTSIGGTSGAGSYPTYDDTAFDGAGALVSPDTSTYLVTDADGTASSAMFVGLVVEFPASPDNASVLSFGTSGGANTNERVFLSSAGTLEYRSPTTTIATSQGGQRGILLLNFKGDDDLDIYYNSLTPINLNPDDAFNNTTRLWLFGRNTGASGSAGIEAARMFMKTGAHSGSDPSIADLMGYLNTTYSVGLTL